MSVPKYIFQLILGGESEILDFKKTITSVSKIAKTMVSFANHKGGKLLVGVNDNGSISGIRSDEEKYMLDMAAGFFCKPAIDITIEEWEFEGKTILEVAIPKGEHRPYAAKDEDGKWWVYIRVKDESLLASKVMVEVLRKQNSNDGVKINYSSKEKALLDFLTSHDRITIKELCQMLNIARWRAQRMLVNLVSIGVIRVHNTEKIEFYTL
ncbi:MAG: putative DNA binding domain-containing protein [Bacteroidota bacterium]|nr:putative DNA binding domain-containing protein [Bacteroidota bacterium]